MLTTANKSNIYAHTILYVQLYNDEVFNHRSHFYFRLPLKKNYCYYIAVNRLKQLGKTCCVDLNIK